MTVERTTRSEVSITMFRDMSHGQVETSIVEVLKLPQPNVAVANVYDVRDFENSIGHRAYLNKPAWDRLIEHYAQRYDLQTGESKENYINRRIKEVVYLQTSGWNDNANPSVDFYDSFPESLEELSHFYKIDFGYGGIKLPPLEDTYRVVTNLFPS